MSLFVSLFNCCLMYVSSFLRVGEAESHGCFAGEASCQTQCFTAMAGDLQGCASGHGEMGTYFSLGK